MVKIDELSKAGGNPPPWFMEASKVAVDTLLHLSQNNPGEKGQDNGQVDPNQGGSEDGGLGHTTDGGPEKPVAG
jgi:hypothetical protein